MLDILLIIAALVVAVLCLGGLVNFNQYVGRRFGYRFFTWKRLGLGGIAMAAIYVGVGGALGTSLGPIAITGGVAIILALAWFNIHRTNLALGLLGSLIETALYVVAALLGIVVALPALLIVVAAAFGGVEPTKHHKRIYYDNY
ncbi:hypothetical protein [Ancylobacter oerskovii]|uniref:Uncharacterized protein n=1 Tax=Ancylobacter oerskovii TaxID=459519 RepID=A0ABW4Z5C0_9HYPH|nr:hypothetical protein [Ancylobacter oerskovii]MBS7545505.1 hypothetical protein [Ancylobacter oerskovii]